MNKFLGFLGIAKKAGKCIEGYNKCEEKLKKNRCYLLILSLNTSQNTKDKFTKMCNDRNVVIIIDYSKAELSNILGKDGINVVGISDELIANRLIQLRKQ